MAAKVRLCSTWGITLLVCLIVAHFDNGEGLPLPDGQVRYQEPLPIHHRPGFWDSDRAWGAALRAQGNHELGGMEFLQEDQGSVSIEQQLVNTALRPGLVVMWIDPHCPPDAPTFFS